MLNKLVNVIYISWILCQHVGIVSTVDNIMVSHCCMQLPLSLSICLFSAANIFVVLFIFVNFHEQYKMPPTHAFECCLFLLFPWNLGGGSRTLDKNIADFQQKAHNINIWFQRKNYISQQSEMKKVENRCYVQNIIVCVINKIIMEQKKIVLKKITPLSLLSFPWIVGVFYDKKTKTQET